MNNKPLSPAQMNEQMIEQLIERFSHTLIINETNSAKFLQCHNVTTVLPGDGTLITTIAFQLHSTDEDSDWDDGQILTFRDSATNDVESILINLLSANNNRCYFTNSANNSSVYTTQYGATITFTCTDYYHIITLHYFPM